MSTPNTKDVGQTCKQHGVFVVSFIWIYSTEKISSLIAFIDNMIQENNDWASSARADTGGNCQLYRYVIVDYIFIFHPKLIIFNRDYKCVGPSIALSSAGVEYVLRSALFLVYC